MIFLVFVMARYVLIYDDVIIATLSKMRWGFVAVSILICIKIIVKEMSDVQREGV